MNPHFTDELKRIDPLIADALGGETIRQRDCIEMIASENMVSRAVLDALGHEITNKTLEGYPGNRFHGGADFVDIVEQAAIDRACQLFGCSYANVQPHSGTQANLAVFFLLLKPGDRILSMDLSAGGHLSHGMKSNISGRWFEAYHYGLDHETEQIDYCEVERLAREIKPKILVAGGSAYPRKIDFEQLGKIATSVGAHFHVDMAHIAGLVAGRVHPSPFPHADIVTCTTTKTMRGPRGGLILTKHAEWAKKLQASVFPGVQGSLHTQVLAAKAVCLGEALQKPFQDYAQRVVANAQALARVLQEQGLPLVSGGTDTHLLLIDLGGTAITGQQAQDALASVGITSNKNPVPNDATRPSNWVGLRLGTSAATTRGLGIAEFEKIGETIGNVIGATVQGNADSSLTVEKSAVRDLCRRFPIYA